MNKKQYQSPLMKVVSTKCVSVLCSSVSGTEKVTFSEYGYSDADWE